MQLSLVNRYKFYFVFYTRFVLVNKIYSCQLKGVKRSWNTKSGSFYKINIIKTDGIWCLLSVFYSCFWIIVSRACIALSCVSGMKWLYTFNVTVESLCPIYLLTVCIGTFWESNMLQYVCRKPCGDTFLKPFLFSKFFNHGPMALVLVGSRFMLDAI